MRPPRVFFCVRACRCCQASISGLQRDETAIGLWVRMERESGEVAAR